jgi:hypothetical protein
MIATDVMVFFRTLFKGVPATNGFTVMYLSILLGYQNEDRALRGVMA